MNLKAAHTASVSFLEITITNAKEVLDLATDNTPTRSIHAVEAGIKKAEEIITRHKGESEITMRMMNELRTMDIALAGSVSEAKTHERYDAA